MTLDLAPFQALIKARCGLLFEGHGQEKLAQALNQRMSALRLTSAADYLRLLAREDEFQSLVSLLTINETYFFREPEQIRLLVDRLVPRLMALEQARLPLRILSAGCSSGEEPYSLVMALTDRYGERAAQLFEFVGGDIDATVLAKAREARYSDFSFRGVPDALRQRYFDTHRRLGGHRQHQLKAAVRARVTFVELNLLAERFAPQVCDFDVIFFRNVSIYFDTATRRQIQRALAGLLRPNGVLVIGTAETLANDLGVLPLVEDAGLFYFARGALATAEQPGVRPLVSPPASPFAPPAHNALNGTWYPTPAPPPSFATAPVPASATPLSGASQAAGVAAASMTLPGARPAAASSAPLAQGRTLCAERRFDEALPWLDQLLASDPTHTEAMLLKAHVLINRKDFAGAQTLAQQVLAKDAWSVDACLLLGLAAKWRGLAEEATRWFKQAAYANSECWPAHYYLADLYRQAGQTDLARRSYRVVLQLLSGDAPDTGIRHVPLGLPEGEVRFLCEHQLAKLPGAAAPAPARVALR